MSFRSTDDAIRDLVQGFRGALDKNLIVVVTADHGESLGEHDFYFEHGWFAFEPTLHVPFLMKLPGQRARIVE